MVYTPQGFPTAAPSKPLEDTIFVAASDARPEVKALADFVCTGTNDDVTIENAINALPAAGGKVKLSEGTFILGSSIDILRSNVTLEGSGPGTKLFLANGANTDVITVGNGSLSLSKIKISNLSIDGNKANQDGLAVIQGIRFYGQYGYNITDSIVENVWATNCVRNGIWLWYSNNCIVANCICTNSEACVRLDNSNNNTIIGNVSHSNYRDIMLYYASYNTVTGNSCQGSTAESIYIVYSPDNTISKNQISNSGADGIFVFASDRCPIIGNQIYYTTRNGIYVYHSSACSVVGNTIFHPGSDGIYNDSYYCTISGNTTLAVPSGYYSIRNIEFSDSTISSNYGDQPIYNSGANCSIIGNRVPTIICTGAGSILIGNVVDYG
jgi:parallel beta-helix repeat protein